MSDTGQLLQVAGTVATIVTGNPLFAIGANLVAGAFFAPDGPTIEGPRLGDLKVQTSSYGTPIPFLYGAMRVAGNLIWVENNKIKEVRTAEEQGGKGGGPSAEVVTYTYYVTCAVSICDGEIAGVRKIWADNVLIYSAPTSSTSPGTAFASGNLSKKITVYTGSESQEPNSHIEADVGTAPAYRGTAYCVFHDLPVEKYGNRIPNFTFEVVSSGSGGFSYLDVFEADPSGYPGTTAANRVFSKLLDANGQSTFTEGYSTGGWVRCYDLGMKDDNLGYIDQQLSAFTDYNNQDVFYEGVGDYQAYIRVSATDNMRVWYRSGISSGYSLVADIPSPDTGNWNSVNSFNGSIWIEDGVLTGISNNLYVQRVRISSTATASTYTPSFTSGALTAGSCRKGKMFVVSTAGYVQEWDAPYGSEAMTFVQEFLPTNYVAFSTAQSVMVYYEAENNALWVAQTKTIYRIDLTTQTLETIGTITEFPGASANALGLFVVRNGILARAYHTAREIYYYAVDTLAEGSVTLQSVVSDLCVRSGLEAADIDVSELSGDVDGFVHSKVGPAAADLKQLQQAYTFDSVQSEYKIKFVPRGGSSAVTLTSADLAAHEFGQDRPNLLTTTREIETGLPQRVNVKYVDANRAYDPNEQYAERLVTNSDAILTTDLAISLTDDRAGEIADILLYEAWVGRQKYQFSLPKKYSYLEPSDIVTLSLDSGDYRVRLESIDFGKPGLLECRGAADVAEIYTSDSSGVTGLSDDQDVSFASATEWQPLDIPILRDADNDAGFYHASYSLLSGWPGMVLYSSADSGATYTQADSAENAATVGICIGALPDHDTNIPDESSSLYVQLKTEGATLSSTTAAGLLERTNLAAIGAPGRWEIVSFQNVSGSASAGYTISTFLRGLYGTEWAAPQHGTRDTFVLLNVDTIERNPLDSTLIGSSRIYAPVTRGSNVADTSKVSFTNNAVGLKPYAPVHIEGSRDGSGNLTITWKRRGRLSGEWLDFTETPLGESSESYEVDIIAAGSPSEAVRTISVSSESASYTAAQQVTDFGSTQSSIEIQVYQLSATVGRGYAGVAIV